MLFALRTLNETSGREAALVTSRLESCTPIYRASTLPRRWFLSLKIGTIDQMSILFKTEKLENLGEVTCPRSYAS